MRGRNAARIERYFPGYRSPKRVYESVLNEAVTENTVWLDIGCGNRLCGDAVLNRELPRRARLVVGCDPDPRLRHHESIRVLALCDAAALPFRDGVFNLVTASMVVEHLEDPDAVFGEVARVSQRAAAFVIFTPNIFNYGMILARVTPYRFHVFYKRLTYYLARGEWREFEDDLFPTWYRANSVGRLRQRLGRAGFTEQRLERLSFAHTFGFVPLLFAASLLFERLIDRPGLELLKADILAVFRRAGGGAGLDEGCVR